MVKYQDLNPKVILNNDQVEILYLESDALLIMVWKRQITFTERKLTFLWALNFSVTHAVKSWLIDDEEIFIITAEEKDWVTYTWTHLVANSHIAKIAVLVADNFPNLHTNVEFTESAIEQYQRFGHTQHEVFCDLQVALAWLKDSF